MKSGAISSSGGIFDIRRLSLGAIVLFAFAARAVFLARGGSQWIFSADADYYLALAQGFLNGCGFAPFEGACGPPEVMRVPGYPLFLIPFVSHYRAVVLVQAVLGALTCLLVARVAARKHGLMAGLIAAAFIATDVPTILATKEIMSEALFQFVAFLAIFACFEGQGSLSTVLLASCIFIRPVGLVLIPVGVLVLIAGRNWTAALIALGVSALVVAGWVVRNDRQAGISSFTVEGAANLFWFTAPGVIARHDQVPYALAEEHLQHSLNADLARVNTYKPSLIWGPAATPAGSHLMLSQAVAVIRRYPADAAIVTLEGFAQLAFQPYQLETGWHGFIENKQLFEGIRLISTALQTVLLFLLWSGVVLAMVNEGNEPERWLLLAASLLLLLAASPFAGNLNARFRTPAIPFAAVLAGIGWAPLVLRALWRSRTT